jgi:cytochrome P450
MSNPLPPYDPLQPEFQEDPYAVYRRYREADPVHWGVPSTPRAEGSWYLFRYEDVTAALRDPRLGREWREVIPVEDQPPPPEPGSFAWLSRHWIVFKDPPDHTGIRGLLNKAFSPRTIEALRPEVEAIADDLGSSAFSKRGEVDLISAFAYPLPVLVIAHILGVPVEDRDRFRAWSGALATAIDITPESDPEMLERATVAMNEMADYLREIMAERRAVPQEDLISTLLSAEEDGQGLGEDELIANLIFLLLAGHETTVNLIGNGTLALLRNPEQLALLGVGSLVPRAVDELLRYESPVQFTSRVAQDDLQIGDKRIKRGEDVGIVLGSANRDPDRFPDPDRLDITREAGRSAAFGLGIHFCLGASLARLEAEIAFQVLLSHLQQMRVVGKPTWKSTIFLRGLEQLVLSGE